MSGPDTAVSARPDTVLVVRDAVPADYPAIRDVVIAAYRQYADLIPPDVPSPSIRTRAGTAPRTLCSPPANTWRSRPGHPSSRSTRTAT